VAAEEIAAGRLERIGGVEQIVVLRHRGEPAAPGSCGGDEQAWLPRYLRGYRGPQRRELPDGRIAGPPDFIGVAAQKSGTSWWHRLIDEHPQVEQPDGPYKEARIFSVPEWEPGRPFDPERYAESFARPAAAITGEWTPDYLWYAWGAPMLRLAAPEAKLLLLLRDPVERYVSALAHMLMYDEPIRKRAFAKVYRAGLYGRQVKRLLRCFPREQVLILQYERCVAEPEAELARTYAFLGLDTGFVPEGIARPRHETTVEKPILPPRFRARLVEGYRRDAARLTALWPELDLGVWRSLA
jgi:hypothetical protein